MFWRLRLRHQWVCWIIQVCYSNKSSLKSLLECLNEQLTHFPGQTLMKFGWLTLQLLFRWWVVKRLNELDIFSVSVSKSAQNRKKKYFYWFLLTTKRISDYFLMLWTFMIKLRARSQTKCRYGTSTFQKLCNTMELYDVVKSTKKLLRHSNQLI